MHPIVAADYSPARRALAERLGADVVVDPAHSQPYATWAEHAAMSPEQKAARPPLQAFLPALKPALIFECVGIPGLLQQVFEGAPRDARIVVVGVCMETDRSEPMLGIMKELNVQYVLGYTPDEFAYSLRLIAEGKVDAASMVTATVGIDGVAAAFDDLANPRSPHQDHRGAVAMISYTGSAMEYFTWLSAKLDSIEAMPSSRVSLFFRNAS